MSGSLRNRSRVRRYWASLTAEPNKMSTKPSPRTLNDTFSMSVSNRIRATAASLSVCPARAGDALVLSNDRQTAKIALCTKRFLAGPPKSLFELARAGGVCREDLSGQGVGMLGSFPIQKEGIVGVTKCARLKWPTPRTSKSASPPLHMVPAHPPGRSGQNLVRDSPPSLPGRGSCRAAR